MCPVVYLEQIISVEWERTRPSVVVPTKRYYANYGRAAMCAAVVAAIQRDYDITQIDSGFIDLPTL